MNIKQLTTILGAFALLLAPTISFASTYQYIGTDGDLHSVEADSASVALATAPNLALHSGVILVGSDGKITEADGTVRMSGTFYQYINTSGNLQSIDAANASIAIATASNISPHSGVILVTNSTKLTN